MIRLCSWLALGFVAATALSPPAPGLSTGATTDAAPMVAPTPTEKRSAPQAERLSGRGAEAYVAARFAADPRFAAAAMRARAALQKKGYVRTNEVVTGKLGVPRATPSLFQRLAARLFPVAHAQDVAQTEQGAVTFWSWDDGDPNTWEGEVFVEDYANGLWSYKAKQMDTETSEELIVIWAEDYGAGGDGWERDYRRERGDGGIAPSA
jgi:hypothetical protein